jgi:hypothetical protein
LTPFRFRFSGRLHPHELHRVPALADPPGLVRERLRLEGGVDQPHPGIDFTKLRFG